MAEVAAQLEDTLQGLTEQALGRLQEMLLEARGDTKQELAIIAQIHRSRSQLERATTLQLRARIKELNEQLHAARNEVLRLEAKIERLQQGREGSGPGDGGDGEIDPRVERDIEDRVSRVEDPAPGGAAGGPGQA